MNKVFNASQKFILVKNLSDEVNFELINDEFNKLSWKNNVDNKISIEMNFFNKEYLEGARNTILHHCVEYLNNTTNIKSLFTGLKMTNSWGNVTEPKHSHHEHVHPFSVVSGVIFLDNNPTNLNLYLEGYQPDIPYFITKNKSYASLADLFREQSINPEQEDNLQYHMVLFLSNSSHFVKPTQETDMVRRTIAFNTFWEGRTGVESDPLVSTTF